MQYQSRVEMTSTISEEKKCSNPTCFNIGVHLCSGCGEEIYCDKKCQLSHWPDHKSKCREATKPVAAVLNQSFESLSIKQLKNLIKAKNDEK